MSDQKAVRHISPIQIVEEVFVDPSKRVKAVGKKLVCIKPGCIDALVIRTGSRVVSEALAMVIRGGIGLYLQLEANKKLHSWSRISSDESEARSDQEESE